MNDTKYFLRLRARGASTNNSFYDIVDSETNNVVLQSTSRNSYVAMIIYVSPVDGKMNVHTRIGREDLIAARVNKNPPFSDNFFLARLKP